MATTSLKLPEELKLRAITAAENSRLSPHAFMVRAIEQAVAAAERRAVLVDEARSAREQMRDDGTGYAADEVHAYLKARIAGTRTARPKAKPWRS